MTKKILFLLATTTVSLSVGAADTSHIFTPASHASSTSQQYITEWINSHCKNLSWVLSIQEKSQDFELCSEHIEKIHLTFELSHLSSEMIFWIRKTPSEVLLEGVYEQYPTWQICNYPNSITRETKTCNNP